MFLKENFKKVERQQRTHYIIYDPQNHRHSIICQLLFTPKRAVKYSHLRVQISKRKAQQGKKQLSTHVLQAQKTQ